MIRFRSGSRSALEVLVYQRERIARILNQKAQQTPLVLPIVIGEAESNSMTLCCGEPPKGYSRCTLRLRGSKAVELGIVEHISAPAVGKILKKTRISRI